MRDKWGRGTARIRPKYFIHAALYAEKYDQGKMRIVYPQDCTSEAQYIRNYHGLTSPPRVTYPHANKELERNNAEGIKAGVTRELSSRTELSGTLEPDGIVGNSRARRNCSSVQLEVTLSVLSIVEIWKKL